MDAEQPSALMQNQNLTESDMSETDDDDPENKKMSGRELIDAIKLDFDEMIEFMDFSFETAF